MNTNHIDPETLFIKQESITQQYNCNIFKGINKKTNKRVCIRIVQIRDKNKIEDIQQDILELCECKFENILQYYGSYVKNDKLWIITEYFDGEYIINLMKPGPIEEKHCSIIIRELLLTLHSLHSNNKIHYDIQASNILLSSNYQLKLTEYYISRDLYNLLYPCDSYVGVPYWRSPEALKQLYSFKSEIWSLGITAYELAKGEPPYLDLHPMRVLFLIHKNDPPKLEGNFSNYFKDFISICLRKDPEERPTVKELLKHPFITHAGPNSSLNDCFERLKRYQEIYTTKSSDEIYFNPINDTDNLNTSDNIITQRQNHLTTVIYPALAKILKSQPTENITIVIQQLKNAFDNIETIQPGITCQIIAYIIEILRINSTKSQ